MRRGAVLVGLLLVAALWGCTRVKPIITPQEYQDACRKAPAGADAACADRICAGFQEVVTDYHEGMNECKKACQDKADALSAGLSGSCLGKVEATRAACLEFCDRKFYRCNCDKTYTPGVIK